MIGHDQVERLAIETAVAAAYGGDIGRHAMRADRVAKGRGFEVTRISIEQSERGASVTVEVDGVTASATRARRSR